MASKKSSKKQAHDEPVQKWDKNWLNEKHPGVALTMIVGAVLIIAVSVFSGIIATSAAKPVINGTCTDDTAAVCGVNKQLTVKLDPVLACGTESCSAPEGKVSVIAFYSPTCPYCEAQDGIFQQLKAQYGDKLSIEYACRDLHSGDLAICLNNSAGKYLDWATSKKLAAQYGADQKGTPLIVVNCKYQRYGSLALQNETLERSELKAMIDGLV